MSSAYVVSRWNLESFIISTEAVSCKIPVTGGCWCVIRLLAYDVHEFSVSDI